MQSRGQTFCCKVLFLNRVREGSMPCCLITFYLVLSHDLILKINLIIKQLTIVVSVKRGGAARHRIAASDMAVGIKHNKYDCSSQLWITNWILITAEVVSAVCELFIESIIEVCLPQDERRERRCQETEKRGAVRSF